MCSAPTQTLQVAHTKLALKYGFAVLAVETKNRSRMGRCFSSSSDPLVSDQWEAPYIIQVRAWGGLAGWIA